MQQFIDVFTQRLDDIAQAAMDHAPALAMAGLILLFTWAVAWIAGRLIGRLFTRAGPRRSLQVFFRKLSLIAIWIVGILVAATVAFPSITPAKLLSALGLGSIAIGFAFKDIFENFIAGMLILLREPFRLGDFVSCEDIEGEVCEITVRDTRLRKVNGEMVTLPNGMLFKNAVRVQTSEDHRRIDAVCGVSYDADADQAADILRSTLESCDSVKNDDRPVQVFLQAFNASSIDFELAWWTGSDPLSERRSRDEVLRAVKAALDEAGIEIPYPQRTLHFSGPLGLAEGQDGDSREREAA